MSQPPRIKCLFNRCSRCNSDEEIEKAIFLSRAELDISEQEEIRRRSLSANRRLARCGNQIRKTTSKPLTTPPSETVTETVKVPLGVTETDVKPIVPNKKAEVASDKPPRLPPQTPVLVEQPKLLYSDIIKKPKPDPKAGLNAHESGFSLWSNDRPIYTVLGDQCIRPKFNPSNMGSIQPLPIAKPLCSTNNPITQDIQNNAQQEVVVEPIVNTNTVDIKSTEIVPVELNVEVRNVVVEATEKSVTVPTTILPANQPCIPPCNPLVTLKKDLCIPLIERSSRIYNAQKLIEKPVWPISQKEASIEKTSKTSEQDAQTNISALIPDTNVVQQGTVTNDGDHLPPKTDITVVQQRVEAPKKNVNKPSGRHPTRPLPSNNQTSKKAAPVNKQYTANSRNRPPFKGNNSRYVMQTPKQYVKEAPVHTFQSRVQDGRVKNDKPESKVEAGGNKKTEVKSDVGQNETKGQKKKPFPGYKRTQYTSSNVYRRNTQGAHVDSESVDEIKRLSKAGCIKAEPVATQQQARPCFKNLHHLCSRARVDLEKPDITIDNIHSQGMPWATKDFLFSFIRMANSWVIMKGYLCIYNNNLEKIEKSFSSGLRASFVKWQALSKEMMTHLLETFRNLEKEGSHQESTHHSNRKNKKVATKTVNSTKNVKSVSQNRDNNAEGARNRYGIPASTKYKPYRGSSKQNRPKQNKNFNNPNSELDSLQNNIKSTSGKKTNNTKYDYSTQKNIFENTTSNIISDSVNNNAWMQFCTHLLGQRDFEEVNKTPASNNGPPILSETFLADNTKVFNKKEDAAKSSTANSEKVLNTQSYWSSVPSTSTEFVPAPGLQASQAGPTFAQPPGLGYEWNPQAERRDVPENTRNTSEPPKHSGRMQRPHRNQSRREFIAYGPDYTVLAHKKSTDFYNNLSQRYGPLNAPPEPLYIPDANQTDLYRIDAAPTRYSDAVTYGGGEPSRTRNVATYGEIPWSLGEEPKLNNVQVKEEYRYYEQRSNVYTQFIPQQTYYNRNGYYRSPNAGDKPKYKKPHKSGNGVKVTQGSPNTFAKPKDATHKPNSKPPPHHKQKWDNRRNK